MLGIRGFPQVIARGRYKTQELAKKSLHICDRFTSHFRNLDCGRLMLRRMSLKLPCLGMNKRIPPLRQPIEQGYEGVIPINLESVANEKE